MADDPGELFDLAVVREWFEAWFEHPFRSNGLFLAAPHVVTTYEDYGTSDAYGLSGHARDPGHPEFWDLLFPPDFDPAGEWPGGADWLVRGNRRAMERDLTLLVMTNFEQSCAAWRRKRRW